MDKIGSYTGLHIGYASRENLCVLICSYTCVLPYSTVSDLKAPQGWDWLIDLSIVSF